MDIGDLLFFVVIAIGVLSSLFGKKPQAKGQTGRRPVRPPRPARTQGRLPDRARETPALNAGDSPAVSSARPQARSEVLSHMEQILRELQLVPPEADKPTATQVEAGRDEPAWGQPPPELPARREVMAVRPVPAPVPQVVEPEADDEVPDDYEAYREEEHQDFHELFVKPVAGPRAAGAARGRRYLSPTSLRAAVLASEILGKPLGLR